MLADIVIDTNVWAHADNPNEMRQAHAVAFLERLLAADTKVCVDPGFSLVESENTSRIGNEYLTHLAALPFAAATLAAIAGSGRIAAVTTSAPDAVRRRISRAVRDPSDRVFARAAYNTIDRVFCSHDFTHFPVRIRAELGRLEIDVVSAEEAVVLI